MASKERLNLTDVKRDALARKAAVLTEIWQRERNIWLLAQLAVNAEIKQRCLEADYLPAAQPARLANGPAPLPRQHQPRSFPFKAWLTAAKIPANHALAYLVSAVGLQRLAWIPTEGNRPNIFQCFAHDLLYSWAIFNRTMNLHHASSELKAQDFVLPPGDWRLLVAKPRCQ
jgi:hypothetical protein